MNIVEVAKKSKEVVNKTVQYAHWPSSPDCLTKVHIDSMLVSIIEERVNGDKAQRWLGWCQCAIVAAGAATLEDMKQINHES